MTRAGTEREASRMRRRVPCSEVREAHAIETSPHQPSLPAPVRGAGGSLSAGELGTVHSQQEWWELRT